MADGPGSNPNPLMSTQRSADSGLQVVLHPLPLLEMSDYITRGCLRQLEGAMVGVLLGQQHGREITVEHSFTCKTDKGADGFYRLDAVWFQPRLEQMRTVHKNPPLDVVGWFTLVDKSGPAPMHLPIHDQILELNESAILLGFHIEDVLHPVAGDPLPITVYESNLEADDGANPAATAAATSSSKVQSEESEDREMKDSEAATKMVLKFRPLPYSTETGEAEMIAMQFIREGGANATAAAGEVAGETAGEAADAADATDAKDKQHAGAKSGAGAKDKGKGKAKARGKGKGKASAATVVEEEEEDDEGIVEDLEVEMRKEGVEASEGEPNKDANLTKEEAEFMSALQAKANAIRMMKSRVDLIVAYLEKLPPRFVAGEISTAEAVQEAAAANNSTNTSTNEDAAVTAPATVTMTAPSHAILRQIQALVTNIGLAAPGRQEALQREILAETADVRLVSLLADLATSADAAREAGKKFAAVEAARSHKARQALFDGPGGGSGSDRLMGGPAEPISLGTVGDLLT